jgi:hypothetical protein
VLGRARFATTPVIVLAGSAEVRPAGVLVETLADAVGPRRALEEPRPALERLAADVAARIEPLSSAR